MGSIYVYDPEIFSVATNLVISIGNYYNIMNTKLNNVA